MNKATSVQSFTYLGLVVSEKNVPKLTNSTLWGYGLQSPLKMRSPDAQRERQSVDGASATHLILPRLGNLFIPNSQIRLRTDFKLW